MCWRTRLGSARCQHKLMAGENAALIGFGFGVSCEIASSAYNIVVQLLLQKRGYVPPSGTTCEQGCRIGRYSTARWLLDLAGTAGACAPTGSMQPQDESDPDAVLRRADRVLLPDRPVLLCRVCVRSLILHSHCRRTVGPFVFAHLRTGAACASAALHADAVLSGEARRCVRAGTAVSAAWARLGESSRQEYTIRCAMRHTTAHGRMGCAHRRRMRRSFASGEITIAWWVFVLNAVVAFGLNLTMCAATYNRIYSAQRTPYNALRTTCNWKQQHTAHTAQIQDVHTNATVPSLRRPVVDSTERRHYSLRCAAGRMAGLFGAVPNTCCMHMATVRPESAKRSAFRKNEQLLWSKRCAIALGGSRPVGEV